MPSKIRIERDPPPSCPASPAKASKRPRDASCSAAGSAAATPGAYSGGRTRPSRLSRVSVTSSGRPVSGCVNETFRGRLLSNACHSD
ncbi:hypothetical protein ACQ859_02505 [Roseateles chitinivorans]|uniref:hypothetical protein n=1 Tax=Roseateles chitinivorans TaxID=2917965 RepID=UPI003D678D66